MSPLSLLGLTWRHISVSCTQILDREKPSIVTCWLLQRASKLGGDTGDRTRNLSIISWLLYRLSYIPMFTLRSFPQGSTPLIPFQVFHPSGEAVFKLALFSHLRLYSIRTDLFWHFCHWCSWQESNLLPDRIPSACTSIVLHEHMAGLKSPNCTFRYEYIPCPDGYILWPNGNLLRTATWCRWRDLNP